ncbi:MAG TPA: DUF3089 domain-containing protein, partial [Leptospiraceae bacterium]|nr:DUF3089 domain-containing protein [Leptospiraceae bacterium]
MKYFTLFIFLISGCAFLVKPEKTIEKNDTLILPDYSNLSFWAAHPEKKDNADLVPDSSLSDRQEFASADVFYIHPTTLIQAKYWNGDLTDSVLNDRTDEGTIKPQASIFNDCCKVYAPRYRQAAIYAFLKETKEGKQALDFAYEDVKKAFEYYARNLNKGRPWILAGHSQGALHSIRLLKEVISNSDIGKSMVAAYVLGWPFRGEEIGFPICKSQEDIRCVIGWNTYVWGNYPSQRKELYNGAVCVNPLSWKADNEYMPKEKN